MLVALCLAALTPCGGVGRMLLGSPSFCLYLSCAQCCDARSDVAELRPGLCSWNANSGENRRDGPWIIHCMMSFWLCWYEAADTGLETTSEPLMHGLWIASVAPNLVCGIPSLARNLIEVFFFASFFFNVTLLKFTLPSRRGRISPAARVASVLLFQRCPKGAAAGDAKCHWAPPGCFAVSSTGMPGGILAQHWTCSCWQQLCAAQRWNLSYSWCHGDNEYLGELHGVLWVESPLTASVLCYSVTWSLEKAECGSLVV